MPNFARGMLSVEHRLEHNDMVADAQRAAADSRHDHLNSEPPRFERGKSMASLGKEADIMEKLHVLHLSQQRVEKKLERIDGLLSSSGRRPSWVTSPVPVYGLETTAERPRAVQQLDAEGPKDTEPQIERNACVLGSSTGNHDAASDVESMVSAPRKVSCNGGFSPSKPSARHFKLNRARKSNALSEFKSAELFTPGSLDNIRGIRPVGSSLTLLERVRTSTPIDPESSLRLCMDGLSIFLLLLDSVVVPYQLAWVLRRETFFTAMSVLTTSFWTLDIAISFLTGYYDENHDLVRSHKMIARRYLLRSFIPDFIVVIADWTEVIVMDLQQRRQSNISFLKSLRILKLGRVVRIATTLRTGKALKVYASLVRFARRHEAAEYLKFSISIFKILFLILWINHLGSCLSHVLMDAAIQEWYEINVVATGNSVSEDSYAIRLYWSVTSMVSGASIIAPIEFQEYVLIICFLLFSLVFATTLISALAAMLMELELRNRDWSQNIEKVREYLFQNDVSTRLSIWVEDEVRANMVNEVRLAEKDVLVLQHLSSKVRAELWWCIYRSGLVQRVFVSACELADPAFMKNICHHAIRRDMYYIGEELFKVDQEAHGGMLLHWGLLHYQYTSHLANASRVQEALSDRDSALPRTFSQESSDFSNAQTLTKGCFVCEIALWSHWKHKGWMEAASPSEILVLLTDPFLKVVACHADIMNMLRHYGGTFVELFMSDLREEIADDLCLTVPEETLRLMLPLEVRIQMSSPAFDHVSKKVAVGGWLGGRHLLQDMAMKVNVGRCDLVLRNNQVTQTQTVISLKITHESENDIGRRVLVVVDSSYKKPSCRLPTTALRASERPSAAVERLMDSELSCVTAALRMVCLEEKIHEEPHQSLGVSIRTIEWEFGAVFSTSDVEEEDLQRLNFTTDPRHSGMTVTPSDMLEAPVVHTQDAAGYRAENSNGTSSPSMDSKGCLLHPGSSFAWIPEDLVDSFLDRDDGEKLFLGWLLATHEDGTEASEKSEADIIIIPIPPLSAPRSEPGHMLHV